MYTCRNFWMKYLNVVTTTRENIVDAFFNPKGMTVYWKQPHSVTNVVLCRSSFAIQIWWYPKNPSVKEYISWPPTPSRTSSVKGVGKGSCRQASFIFLRLTQMRTSQVFLSWTTIGLIHYDSSTGSMILESNIHSSLALTRSLYRGFNWYGLCCTGFASGFNGIFISPRSPNIPFISENRVGKRSWNSCNRSLICTIV